MLTVDLRTGVCRCRTGTRRTYHLLGTRNANKSERKRSWFARNSGDNCFSRWPLFRPRNVSFRNDYSVHGIRRIFVRSRRVFRTTAATRHSHPYARVITVPVATTLRRRRRQVVPCPRNGPTFVIIHKVYAAPDERVKRRYTTRLRRSIDNARACNV